MFDPRGRAWALSQFPNLIVQGKQAKTPRRLDQMMSVPADQSDGEPGPYPGYWLAN